MKWKLETQLNNYFMSPHVSKLFIKKYIFLQLITSKISEFTTLFIFIFFFKNISFSPVLSLGSDTVIIIQQINKKKIKLKVCKKKDYMQPGPSFYQTFSCLVRAFIPHNEIRGRKKKKKKKKMRDSLLYKNFFLK